MSKDRNPGNDDQGEDDTQRHEDQNSRMRSSGEVLGSGEPRAPVHLCFRFHRFNLIHRTFCTAREGSPLSIRNSKAGAIFGVPPSDFHTVLKLLFLYQLHHTLDESSGIWDGDWERITPFGLVPNPGRGSTVFSAITLSIRDRSRTRCTRSYPP